MIGMTKTAKTNANPSQLHSKSPAWQDAPHSQFGIPDSVYEDQCPEPSSPPLPSSLPSAPKDAAATLFTKADSAIVDFASAISDIELRTILQSHLALLQDMLVKHQNSIIQLLKTHCPVQSHLMVQTGSNESRVTRQKPSGELFGRQTSNFTRHLSLASRRKPRTVNTDGRDQIVAVYTDRSEYNGVVASFSGASSAASSPRHGHVTIGARRKSLQSWVQTVQHALSRTPANPVPERKAEHEAVDQAAAPQYNELLEEDPLASRKQETKGDNGSETQAVPSLIQIQEGEENRASSVAFRDDVNVAEIARTSAQRKSFASSSSNEKGRVSMRMPQSALRQEMKDQANEGIADRMNKFAKKLGIDEQDKRRMDFVNSKAFSLVSSLCIMWNALYIGYQLDFMVKESYSSSPSADFAWIWIDLMFLIFFTVELIMRCYSAGIIAFFMGREKLWNRFDGFIVLLSIIDFILDHTHLLPGFSLSIFRTFRLVRIMRIMRVGKVVPVVRHLQIMVFSLYGCMSSFFPALILITFVMYIFGTIMLGGVAHYLKENGPDSDPAKDLIKYFGSVPLMLSTLLSSVSGGQDWQVYADALEEVGLFYRSLFVFYVCSVVFGVLNILTGIFVNVAIRSCNISRDIVTEGALHEKQQTISNMVEAFMEADTDKSGTLSFEEFQSYMRDEKVRAYFTSLDIDVGSAERIFDLLDEEGNGDGQVDLIEFVEGCLAFKGHARVIDTHFIEEKTNILLDHIENVELRLGDRITMLAAHSGYADDALVKSETAHTINDA